MTTLRALILAALAAAALIAPAVSWADSPGSLLYERVLMKEAGARCRLFAPEITAALTASAAQARGALLRGGAAGDTVRQIEGRAAMKAAGLRCNMSDLLTAAARVRKAFDGYAQLRDMSFPGVLAGWQAERKPWPLVVGGRVVPGPRWRLSQPSGAAVVGLTTAPGLTVVSTAPAPGSPSGARLILRDPAKAEDAVIDPRRKDLAGRAPPRSVTQAFLAEAVGPAPLSLLPMGARGGVMAVFPPAAEAAMATLDPRETATVELVFPTRAGERVQTVLVEVGDFAAGRAFLAAGR